MKNVQGNKRLPKRLVYVIHIAAIILGFIYSGCLLSQIVLLFHGSLVPFSAEGGTTKEFAPNISTQFSAEYIFSMLGPVSNAMITDSGPNCTRKQFGFTPCCQLSGDYTKDFPYFIYSLEYHSIPHKAHFNNQI